MTSIRPDPLSLADAIVLGAFVAAVGACSAMAYHAGHRDGRFDGYDRGVEAGLSLVPEASVRGAARCANGRRR